MADPEESDRAHARGPDRAAAIGLIVGALGLLAAAAIEHGGPVTTTMWSLVSAAALWVATRPLRD